MNKLFTVLLFCFFLSMNTNVLAEESTQGRYETKSAVIEYAISGNIQGNETAYIDNFGSRESRYTKYTLDMTGNDREQEHFVLRKGDMLTNVDLKSKKSISFDLSKEMTPGLNIHLTGKEMADYSPEGLKKMRAVFVGEESVAGKSCKLYKLPFLESQLWLYKNIPLRYKYNARGFMVEYMATAIKEDVEIPEEKFKIPEGVMNVGLVSENNIMGAIQPRTQ